MSDTESTDKDVVRPDHQLSFPIVAVGASAGGLEAFMEFLDTMDDKAGMAVVFILHLPPKHESAVAAILSRHTAMPVQEVANDMLVEVNHVYVIKPGHTLTLHKGHFKLGEDVHKPGHGRPVDDFFKSLAYEQQERAICILMSGMGSNGSAGAQIIKGYGGLCIAQDPETAKFPSMPRHMIDSGQVDFILSPADMPQVLKGYITHLPASNQQITHALVKQEQQHLHDIFAILRTRTKQDFSGYKKPTVLRRVERRMNLNRVTQISEYVKVLRQSPTEVATLAEDLLIHVTSFFRDPESWEVFRQQVIVPLIASRETGSAVRSWVTACSSGEEAYTLAMLLVEESERTGKMLDIKVFATDMADRSLYHARSGIYPGGIESEVSKERLDHFFHKEDSMYRVKQELRERVVFASQNVLQDPPFSRLDIITCRNLLIYLEPGIQQRILMLMHFGLRESGILFLGSSEAITGADEFFDAVDKKHRIFRRVGPTRHGMTQFPLPTSAEVTAGVSHRPHDKLASISPSLSQLTHKALLAQHTPAAVTVDRDHHIIYFHGNTDPFLTQPRGETTRNLLKLVKETLRGTVRIVLQKAGLDNRSHTLLDGWLELEDGLRHRVAVTASVLDQRMAPDYYVVSFEDRGEIPAATPLFDTDTTSPNKQTDVQEELMHVKQELQSTIEELQTSNEEMKASNEEVMSMNEELQSTNEELETSKEEMQSLNEELTTVNAQLQAKMEELQTTSNDLTSLLSSTEIAVLFLDTKLRIRRFTPAVKQLLELISTDVGRPLSDLARKFTDPQLNEDAQNVLERLITVEREVQDNKGRQYLRRILPYRTTDNRIDGVVIVFVDTTVRMEAQSQIRQSKEMLRKELQVMEHLHSVTTSLFSISDFKSALYAVLDATIELFNAEKGKIHMLNEETGRFDIVAWRGLSDVFVDKFNSIAPEHLQVYLTELKNKRRVVVEDILEDKRAMPYREMAKLGGYQAGLSIALVDHENKMIGFISVHYKKPHRPDPRELRVSDIFARQTAALLDRLKAEKVVRLANERLNLIADMVPDLLWQNDASGQSVWFNQKWTDYTGLSHDELKGEGWKKIIEPEDLERTEKAFGAAIAKGTGLRHELRIRSADDGSRWFLLQAQPLKNEQGKVVQWFGAATDIHQDRTTLNALRASELRHRLTVSDMEDYAVIMLDTKGNITTWNTGAKNLFGYDQAEILNEHVSLTYIPNNRLSATRDLKLQKARQFGRAMDERWYQRKDGSRFWGSGIVTALQNENDEFCGYSKVLHDTTSTRLVEEAQLRLAAIVESSNDAIISFKLDGSIVSWNPAATAMFGYDVDEALAMNLEMLCGQTTKDAHEALMENLRQGKNMASVEAVCLHKDGHHLDVSLSASCTHDMNDEPLAAVIVKDVTDRKQLDEALNHAKNAAEEANHIKDEFLATLSHELRTPLAAILLWTKMLHQTGGLPAQVEEGLHAIQSSAEAQKTLIDDLLDTSRITAGTLRLQMRKTKPVELIHNAIEAIQPAATAKGVEITCDLDPRVQIMLADPGRLRQVIWNLLTNAVKFTSSGGKVHIQLQSVDGHVQLKVTDTGIGIAPEFLPQLFTPFRQADASSSRRNGGLGLGLAISKQLVELHGGSVAVASDGLGKGSTFTIRIPHVTVAEEKTRIYPQDEANLKLLQGKKVLLVEDDIAMRQVLTHMLEQKQILITAVDSAHNALATLEQQTPDMILCDIGLPDVDGYELLRKIRLWETSNHISVIPSIALTSFARPQDRDAALKAGFQAYLTKPVDSNALFKTMAQLVK